MLRVLAPRAMTLLTTDVPLRHLLGVNVVIHRMAAITGRTGGPLHIVWRIEWHPPVGAVGDEIGAPNFVGHIPLRCLWEIIGAFFCEGTLLPKAAINQRNLFLRKLGDLICGKVWKDGLGM